MAESAWNHQLSPSFASSELQAAYIEDPKSHNAGVGSQPPGYLRRSTRWQCGTDTRRQGAPRHLQIPPWPRGSCRAAIGQNSPTNRYSDSAPISSALGSPTRHGRTREGVASYLSGLYTSSTVRMARFLSSRKSRRATRAPALIPKSSIVCFERSRVMGMLKRTPLARRFSLTTLQGNYQHLSTTSVRFFFLFLFSLSFL